MSSIVFSSDVKYVKTGMGAGAAKVLGHIFSSKGQDSLVPWVI